MVTLKFNRRFAIVAIAFTALIARLFAVTRGGGFKSVFGYDDGVYMGAATGFSHGLIPYRDFLFVHPPGILFILSPLGYLARFIGDANAFVLGRIFCIAVGITTTILVTKIGFRAGNWSGIFAGFTYALWLPVVREERTTLLEVFCVFFLASAIYVISKDEIGNRDIVIAGISLGLATSVKLWMAIPVLVIALWLILRRRFKPGIFLGSTAFATFSLICTPFMFLSHGKMLDLVWKAQISRAGRSESRLPRFAQIFNIPKSFAPIVNSPFMLGLLLILVSICLLLTLNKFQNSRLYFVLVVAQISVLMLSPIFFHGYSSYVAIPIILLVALFFQQLIDFKYFSLLLVPVFVFSLVLNFISLSELIPQEKFPAQAIAEIVKDAKCVTSDSPSVLLLSNTLTRALNNNCQVIFDVDGEIYGVNRGENNLKLTSMDRRRNSIQYQNKLIRYFKSGDVIVLKREIADALTPMTLKKLNTRELELSSGLYQIYEK